MSIEIKHPKPESERNSRGSLRLPSFRANDGDPEGNVSDRWSAQSVFQTRTLRFEECVEPLRIRLLNCRSSTERCCSAAFLGHVESSKPIEIVTGTAFASLLELLYKWKITGIVGDILLGTL